ncbi:MAG: four helix bundle protein [Gemmatimonadota bacterium]
MGYYRDLEAWKEAHQLVLAVYRLSGSFPRDERFGLTAQVRRAAVSVTSNIAEGSGRRTDPWMLTFLGYAMGSLQEVDSQILVAKDLEFAPLGAFGDIEERINRVGRLLSGLRSALERSKKQGPSR